MPLLDFTPYPGKCSSNSLGTFWLLLKANCQREFSLIVTQLLNTAAKMQPFSVYGFETVNTQIGNCLLREVLSGKQTKKAIKALL